MKILKKQVLRGPNIWSNYRKNLIQMRLDLQEMEDFPTDKLPGFNDRLKSLLPGMVTHECSEGIKGGFFERLRRGTWLGHVIEHVALELQTLAGMEAGYGRTRGTGERGVYNVVFAYTVEEAGLYAGEAAFRLVEALAANQDYDLEHDLEQLRELLKHYGLGPSTKCIVDEAERRKIPWKRTGSNSAIQLGYGVNQSRFQATITSKTPLLSVETAGDKEDTKKLLKKSMFPVSAGSTCRDEAGLKNIIDQIGYPIVLKPLNSNQGKGASINVTGWENAVAALEHAQQYSKSVLVEKFISGFDFRVLVVDNKYVAASKRIPAHVVGDGHSTISKLLDIVNSDPKRGSGHERTLTKIVIDRDSMDLLTKAGFNLESIPQQGEIVYLKSTANLSTGGTAIDVTDEVHPENIFMCERIARTVGLDICGVDIMASSLTEPLRLTGGVILEVNAAPGLRMHLDPTEGQPRNVGAAIVDMLYPDNKPSRIPIIAVTGTNGKTTTTRMLAHLVKSAGYRTGYTTTDGIYINDFIIEEGDTTGPLSAGFILSDPTIEFAVLETARGGLLRSGLSYDQCDIGIITNIKEDHLGLNDINTLEDLANVKGVVARSVKEDGWAILNGEDQHCINIGKELDCNVAYFSMDANNEFIKERRAVGGTVAVLEDGFIVIYSSEGRISVENVAHIPITYAGTAPFMIANSLAAALAGFLYGFSLDQIRNSMRTFMPGFEQTPGRLNRFDFQKFGVLVDYAHNPHGYAAVEGYLANVQANRKIGIISGLGDRRDEDITQCALIACRMFDYIIIRQEHDLRGRTEESINGLLLQGIMQSCRKLKFEMVAEETAAIRRAMEIAQEGDLIVALSDQYKGVVKIIQEELQKEQRQVPIGLRPVEDQASIPFNINPNKTYHGRTA